MRIAAWPGIIASARESITQRLSLNAATRSSVEFVIIDQTFPGLHWAIANPREKRTEGYFTGRFG